LNTFSGGFLFCKREHRIRACVREIGV
jgi:hypothetical protein